MSVRNTFPQQRPTLNLDFANSKTLDPRITFTRSQTGNGVTYVGEDGLIKYASADEPRFDHDPETGECLGLLIEEARTNLFAGNHNPAPYFTGGASRSTVNIILPSGEIGAALETDSSAFAENYENLAASSNTSPGYLTFYAKKKTSGTGTLTITMEGGGTSRSFNSKSINSDTWTKISTTHNWSAATSTGRRFDFYLPTASSSDGDTSFYMSFIQFEEGYFPTSYIPTSGGTATRNPDNVSMTGNNFSDWYNQSEGTFYSQFKGESRAGSSGYVTKIVYSISDGSFNNSHYGVTPESNGDMYWYSVSSGAGQGLLGITPLQPFASNVVYKSAYAIKTNDRALSINGYIDTDSTTTLPVVNRLYIGSSWTGSSIYLGGHISKLTYYPTRLTNAQLQTLTK